MQNISIDQVIEKLKLSINKSDDSLVIFTDDKLDNLSYCKGIKRVNDKENYFKEVIILNATNDEEFNSFCSQINCDSKFKVYIMNSLDNNINVKNFLSKYASNCYSETIDVCNKITPTPDAIIDTLKFLFSDNLAEKKVLVTNRSNLIGRPVINKLLDINATVICAHTKTSKNDLEKMMENIDIIVTAAGRPKCFKLTKVDRPKYIIDAGINVVDGKVVGDWDYESLNALDVHITPNPGGIGKLTTYELFKSLS